VNRPARIAAAAAANRPGTHGGSVPSPCVSICRIDAASGLCDGCLRTLDEIACWGSMNDDARRTVCRAIDARRERQQARSEVRDEARAQDFPHRP